MRVSQENTTNILGLSQDLIQSGSQKTTSAEKAKTFKEQQKEKFTDLNDIEGYRETYGLDTIENMTTAEYAAFQRATSNLSPAEKIKAAQSIHLVAAVYFQVQTDSLSKERGELWLSCGYVSCRSFCTINSRYRTLLTTRPLIFTVRNTRFTTPNFSKKIIALVASFFDIPNCSLIC